MSKYDILYNQQVNEIIENGIWDKDQIIRPKWYDGTPAYTKSIISKQLIFDGSEVPILTSKRVSWKTAIHEILWFYVKRTSDCAYLDENKVKIWKEWTREDNTIGRSYGYQLGKNFISKVVMGNAKYHTPEGKLSSTIIPRAEYTNQVQKLIDGIKNDPASRRHIISLWNIDDAWDMALQPCVWHNQFLIKEKKLNLIVGIRSNDIALGQPFNVFQYYVLQRMISQITGYEIGQLIFNINDNHIYERHIDVLKKQILQVPFESPTLYLNPNIKNFDDFKIRDFILDNYQHHPSLDFEVAI